jgi:signal transduction histidine kinase
MSTLKSLLEKIEMPMRQRLKAGATILLGAAGLTAILLNLDFNLLEANLYDLRVARGMQAESDPSIALIQLDDVTTKSLDEFSPLPLDMHAQFLEALEKLEPRAVGYLVDLNQVNQVNPELMHTQWSKRFVEAASRMEAHGMPVMLGTPYDVTGEVIPPYPLSTLPHAIARIHKDGNVFSEDRVTRRALTYLNEKPVFHVEFAQRLGLISSGQRPSGSFHVPEADGEFFFFRYHGNTVLDPAHPGNIPYRTYSFVDVLKGNIPAGALHGKIVLVSTLSKEDSTDFAVTPYSKSSFASPKLVVHANILDSVIHDDGLIRVPNWANWMTTFAVCAFVLWWVLNSTPLYGVFATLSLVLSVLVMGQLLFQLKGLWLRESQPLVGIFVGYYLVVPYRLIREYKKRWDYQKKNELLTQVEEMKTNFVYLVTHDLKTPVARIQGLAEVLLRKAGVRLEKGDRDTLGSIMNATDELNHFINSILELSKVESNRLQLHFESKDINQLIERSVEGFKAQARARQIELNVNLEPLFPVKIDAGLIAKVINNLIDNALKYSPTDSEIFVESREEGEWIEISVRDQGIGMTVEERHNLFTRFYRAKNDTTTQITGTGLGLYLTKYFIEAHHGRVEVVSEKDKGSTFRIFLPLAGTQASSTLGTSACPRSGVPASDERAAPGLTLSRGINQGFKMMQSLGSITSTLSARQKKRASVDAEEEKVAVVKENSNA